LLLAVVAGGCGSQTGCKVSGKSLVCVGETFNECAVAGCSVADYNCQNPPSGCEIAPGTILAHYSVKPPNNVYVCGDAKSTCGTWTEASCRVTVMPDSGASVDYTIQDSTCP
jgi:hypothetical protein